MKQLARAKQTELAFKARGCVINQGRRQQTEHLLSFCKTLLLPVFSQDELQTNNSAGPGTGVGDEHGLPCFVSSLTWVFSPRRPDGDVSYPSRTVSWCCLGSVCVRSVLGKVRKFGWVTRPVCEMASTLCFCCSTGAIHIQPNGGILLAHTCTHSCSSQASAWWPPINKKSSHSQRQRGRDLKIRWTNLIVESARAAGPGLEGGKGKWRAEERKRGREKRERDCSCVSLRGFLWLSLCRPHQLRKRGVCVVGVECTVGLHYSTCSVLSHTYAWEHYMLAAEEGDSVERLEGGRYVCFCVWAAM